LQQVAEKISVLTSPKVIFFPNRMGAQAQIPPEQQPQQNQAGYHPPTHGTWAQWVAPAVTLIIGIVSVSLMVHYRNEDNAAKISDEHIRNLVEDKFKPVNRDVVEDKIGKLGDKIDKLGEKVETLSQRVSNIEGRLDKRVSTLERRADQQVSLAKLVLSDLQRNLNATDRSTPGYWPTAAEFVTYRSQVNVGADFQTLSRPDMPNCTDKPPTPMEYRMTAEEEKNSAGPNPNQFIPALYENCRFVLDSPEEAARVPYAREGRSFLIKFKNCQIIYNGGVIAILNPHPRPSLVNGKGPARGDVYIINGQQIDFENCLFLFSIKTIPPQDGQSMTRELLAQSGPVFSYGKIKIG
jgi:hypothetical protein